MCRRRSTEATSSCRDARCTSAHRRAPIGEVLPRSAKSLAPYGYCVTAIPVRDCLHLKTACSALPDGRFLVNSRLDRRVAAASRIDGRQVPEDEPWAGRRARDRTRRSSSSDAFPETARLLGGSGARVIPVPVSEFAKAEGGVTCLSLVFRALPALRRPLFAAGRLGRVSFRRAARGRSPAAR